ncbi:hypothetical protein [Rhizobium sp. RAF56]|uniref:hypothetical protein n=1 Tax=Rhizobium sp. RAF56 TaxID=3233062 RepID=UPI003F9BB606
MNFSFGDQPSIGEAVKNVDGRLVIGAAVARHAAIDAANAGNRVVHTREAFLGLLSAVFLADRFCRGAACDPMSEQIRSPEA